MENKREWERGEKGREKERGMGREEVVTSRCTGSLQLSWKECSLKIKHSKLIFLSIFGVKHFLFALKTQKKLKTFFVLLWL